MQKELLSHKDMCRRFCPLINYSCKGAYCVSFKAEAVSRKSTKPHNAGDWEPIPLHERKGFCSNPQL